MFGHKKKLAQKKYQEFLYLDGLAITASILLDRAEVEPEIKFVAVGLKYAMEKFADEFGKGEQMYDIYKQYPKLKWLEGRQDLGWRNFKEVKANDRKDLH